MIMILVTGVYFFMSDNATIITGKISFFKNLWNTLDFLYKINQGAIYIFHAPPPLPLIRCFVSAPLNIKSNLAEPPLPSDDVIYERPSIAN